MDDAIVSYRHLDVAGKGLQGRRRNQTPVVEKWSKAQLSAACRSCLPQMFRSVSRGDANRLFQRTTTATDGVSLYERIRRDGPSIQPQSRLRPHQAWTTIQPTPRPLHFVLPSTEESSLLRSLGRSTVLVCYRPDAHDHNSHPSASLLSTCQALAPILPRSVNVYSACFTNISSAMTPRPSRHHRSSSQAGDAARSSRFICVQYNRS